MSTNQHRSYWRRRMPQRPIGRPSKRGQLALRLAIFAVLGLRLACETLHAQTASAGTTAKADPKLAELLDPKVGADWVRIKFDDKNKPLAMQTAIVRYTGTAAAGGQKRDVSVDLIGAVHVGDIAYYDELNKQFMQYDALLYELVAPPGTVVERGRGTSSAHPVGILQNGMKTMLELDHQLEKVDYTKANFVHADMSPEQFEKAMRDRNEGWLQMYFRLLGVALAQQNEMSANAPSDLDVFAALFAKDRPRRLKILLGKQLAEMETLMVSFGGEQGSAIISDRNKMALKVLKEQLAAGKKRLGIFYGAGHLQDMDQRLRKDFELKPVAITWLTAWNLAERP
ncbi:MAG: hypothetical protein WD669_01960 [Pirellulales bacterium]